MSTIRFIDLFCGLGAFHEAFKRYENAKCVFACDIDDNVRRIYELNHGIKPFGDITKVKPEEVTDHDVLCAGFPCQPFSIAGKKNGFNDDVKGNLFFDILRVIDVKEPPYIVLENVKNITSIDDCKTFERIVQELEKRDYNVSYRLLNAVDYGSPQHRERMFIIAVKYGRNPFVFPFPDTTNIANCVKDILTNIEHEGDLVRWQEKYDMKNVKESKSSKKKPKMIFTLHNKLSGKGGRQGERIYDVNFPGITICAASGGPGSKTGLYKTNEDTIRRLNVVECLRMFGFPDDFKYLEVVDENKMLFYLGNSIVVNVAQSIVDEVLRAFKDQST